MGKFFFFRKIYFWSYCNETSQERSLGCVDVLLGFDIFKMAAVAMVTNKVEIYFFSDCN
jgi:hypothetical protein